MKAVFTLFLLVASISCCCAQYLMPKTESGILNYNKGVDLCNSQHFDQALASLKKAEAAEPNSVQVHLLVGMCLYSLSKDDAGIAEIRKALSLDPGNKDAQAELKNAQQYAIDDQAQTYLDDAQTAAEQNDDDGTLKNARACLQLQPHNAQALFLEAAALHDGGDWISARADYRLAIKYGDKQIQMAAKDELSDEDTTFESNVYITFSLFLISLLWLWFRSPILTRRALAYPTDRSVTPRLGFNLGISFLAPFWGIANQVYKALWAFVPSVGVIVHIYYGFVGQNRAWFGPRQQAARAFVLTQLAWAKALAWFWIALHVIWLATLYHDRDPSGPYGQRFVIDLLCADAAMVALMVTTTSWYLKRLPPPPPVTAPPFPSESSPFN